MKIDKRPKTGSLLRDERGAVFIEYLVITVFCLGVAVALTSLVLAVRSSRERAVEVLSAETP